MSRVTCDCSLASPAQTNLVIAFPFALVPIIAVALHTFKVETVLLVHHFLNFFLFFAPRFWVPQTPLPLRVEFSRLARTVRRTTIRTAEHSVRSTTGSRPSHGTAGGRTHSPLSRSLPEEERASRPDVWRACLRACVVVLVACVCDVPVGSFFP